MDSIIKPLPTAIVTLKVQKWDTDGEKVKLPKTVKVEITFDRSDAIEEIHEEAMDKAADATGWCIESCTIENIKFN
jgi:hypothetical protein